MYHVERQVPGHGGAKIMTNINISELSARIENVKSRSAWEKGVKSYAEELIYKMEKIANYKGTPNIISVESRADFEQILLNGADNWSAYSYGGCSLIWNEDIAKTLCTPSELKRTKNGRNDPNSRETWCDVQARALSQAFSLICRQINF